MANPVQPPLNTPPLPRSHDLFVSPWALFFTTLANASGGGNAPANADYVLTAPDASLPNARVATTSPTIAVDTATAAQIKWNLRDTTVTPGTYGDSTHIPQVTFDAQGRATAASNIAIAVDSQRYMPVFVGGLAVTAGDILIAIPWDVPTS